ncbi:MAG: 3'-5' exonuclease [Reinekea sp.]|jgi:DNA polymerase III subunit epsilon
MFNWLRKVESLPWKDRTYLVIDMELTGLEPQEDAIISAGSVMIKQGRIILDSAEHHYFSPVSLMGVDVTQSAHIHLITDNQLEVHGKPLADWLARLSQDLMANAWVFHHAQLDSMFLKTFSERLQIALPSIEVIDTLANEKRLHPEAYLESQAQLNLGACRARYGLPAYRQHHALSDALATAELFLAQQSLAGSC